MIEVSSPIVSVDRFVPHIALCTVVAGLKVAKVPALPRDDRDRRCVADLFAGQKLSFPFEAYPGIETIDVEFGTHNRCNKGTLTSKVLDAKGRTIVGNSRELGSLADNRYSVVLELYGAPLVAGGSYTLVLESSGDRSQTVSVWGHSCAPFDSNDDTVLLDAVRGRTFFPRPFRNPACRLRIVIVTASEESNDFRRRFSSLAASEELTMVDYSGLPFSWRSLVDADIVFFASHESEAAAFRLREICYALHRSGVVAVAIVDDRLMPKWARACHYALLDSDRGGLFDNAEQRPIGTLDIVDLRQIIDENHRRRMPSVAVVCGVSDRSKFAGVCDTLRDGTGAKLEFICVSDGDGPGRSGDLISGIAASWAEALSSAEHDIVILVGPTIRTSAEFVDSQIFEHWYRDVEVVSTHFEKDGAAAQIPGSRSYNGDDYHCDLRALSFKNGPARIDAIAAFSEAPDDFAKASEIFTRRLEKRGAVVRRRPQTELSDGKTARDTQSHGWKGLGRNFAERAKSFIESRSRLQAKSKMEKGLRVLSYRWHAAHQYEIYRLPMDFTLATGFGNHITEFWPYSERPLRSNVRFRHRSEIDPRDYDVCILHFDENVLCPELSNGVLPHNWGEPFTWLLSLDKLPKIAVCHGTPAFRGQYGVDRERKIEFSIYDEERSKLVSALSNAGAFVVCNSWQAHAEWGFENCRVIWHGFDPREFRAGSHSRGVLTLRHDDSRPHYRGRFEQIEVESRLDPDIEIFRGACPEIPFEIPATNAFAERQFSSYVRHIGQFKMYLNTTLRSPMPRSRGEAMMAGVIPVSLANHDVSMFIENGVDGFYSERVEDLAQFINGAIRDERALASMSAAARRKAIEVFHHQRFQNDWRQLLEERLGRRIRRIFE